MSALRCCQPGREVRLIDQGPWPARSARRSYAGSLVLPEREPEGRTIEALRARQRRYSQTYREKMRKAA